MRPTEHDCDCVHTDDRTGLCAEHFLALIDQIGDES